MNALKAVVIFMGLLIVIGAAVVVVTIINRLGTPAEEAAPPPAAMAPAAAAQAFGSRDLDLPAGARIVETLADAGRLYLRVRLAGGEERVLVIDPATGATLGTLSVPAGQ